MLGAAHAVEVTVFKHLREVHVKMLCLDVGTKRIGVAVSDALGLAAHPLTVMTRHELAKDLAVIIGLCREHEVARVIVGLPLDAEGRQGPAAKKMLTFVRALEEKLKGEGLTIPVEPWDERYSTAESEEFLIEADVSRAKRKRVIDMLAAARILERYMNSKC